MRTDEKGSHKERVEAMQKKFDVRTCIYINLTCIEDFNVHVHVYTTYMYMYMYSCK